MIVYSKISLFSPNLQIFFLHIKRELHYNDIPIQQPGVGKVQECQIEEMITLVQVRFMKKMRRRRKKKRRKTREWKKMVQNGDMEEDENRSYRARINCLSPRK